MPERSQFDLDRDKVRRANIQLGRSDADFGKHTMSRPWQAYNQMQTMQRQADPDLDRLKELRSDWNRNLKYTPSGMRAAGVSTPQGAMEGFRTGTEAFRQANKPAYNRMYPMSGMAMDYPQKGGLSGMFLSEVLGGLGKNIFGMGKDIHNLSGISGLIDDSEEDKERYITETFGPHLEGVPYGGPPPYSDVYEGPRPHEDMPYLSDEAAAIQKEFNTNSYFQDLAGENVVLPFEKERRGHPHLETYEPDRDIEAELGVASPHDPTELGEPTGSTLADVLSEDDFDDPFDVRTPEGAAEYDALREEEDYPEPPLGDMSQMDWRTYMQILKRLGQESADIYAQNANRGGIMGVI